MSEEHRTPYADDTLNVENGTQPEEIQEFVFDRATNPIRIDDLVVWNFNNHEVNREALKEQLGGFIHDEFVIPYQASGVWGYMISLLPDFIAEAEILAYNQSRGQYNPYPNFIRHSEEVTNEQIRDAIAKTLQQ